MRPTLVVADVHLTRHTPLEVSRDLADLVRSRRGDRLLVAGDLFDRSAEPEPVPSFASIFGIHAELRRALAEHLDAGGELSLLAGNHDAEVGEGSFPDELGRALGVSTEATTRITSSPWMLREGDLHVEHGHVFDPDNAPAHPLVRGTPALGVRFVHEFIAPTGAYAYLNRNDKLPLELFVEAFTRYGVRGPYVVATFFRASFSALREAGPFSSFDDERARGEQLIEAFAAERGLAAEALRDVVARAERPTTTDFGATFARLYLDRVACTLALLAAGGCALAGKRSSEVSARRP
jgi:UDP-2,3-diacylglucosamine pyrophosphatase LpxH